jgi:hypothetical protein
LASPLAPALASSPSLISWWSGFDIRDPASRNFVKRMSNPGLHQKAIFANGPLILTFAKVPAETGCEC